MRSRLPFIVVLAAPFLVSASIAYANVEAEAEGQSSGPSLEALVFALVVTVVIEVLLAALAGVPGKGLAVIGVMNVLTNLGFNVALFAWLVLTSPGVPGEWLALPVLEVLVVLVEWTVLLRVLDRSRWRPSRVLLLSAGLNAASFLLGAALTAAFL